nr:unnamed protein product [Digitaria exilis]
MARPPRRSVERGRRRRRRRRRRLHILTDHDGGQGMSIYKLNEDGFDSDDAYSEHSEDSGSIKNDSDSDYDDASSEYSKDSGSDDTSSEYSRGSSGSISSESSKGSASVSYENERRRGYLEEQDRFDSEYDVDPRARRLRRRRLVGRLGRQPGCPYYVAAGTKIFALNSSSSHHRVLPAVVNLVLDAATRTVSATPPFQSPKKSAAFWSAGGAIYALGHRVTGDEPIDDQDQEQEESCLFERLGHGDREEWEALPPPPFSRNRYLESHAVHPDGATVFLSFDKGGTFSFNGERREWARRGEWELPFDGEAFYVRDMDAWVGLCSHHRGCLAACRVVGDDGRRGPLECKCGREVLFRTRWRRHRRANLVHMGDARFCLLETMTRERDERSDTAGMILPMLLRAVTFRVRYNFDGRLRVVDRRSKVYKLPWHPSEAKPLGFWI